MTKNKGWKNIKNINDVLIGKSNDLNCSYFNLDNYLCVKYAPITLVDVEKSFSMYTNILSLNR